jgi:predicted metal-dependent hydrolase
LSLTIEQDGSITIRAPKGIGKRHIDDFLKQKKKWIIKHVEKAKLRNEKSEIFAQKIDKKEIPKYKKMARKRLEERADHFSSTYGLRYKSIRLSSAKTRWGSCGPTNNLNFNWVIIFAPPQIIDYLVVHELAHTRHKNHQKHFWQTVEEMHPEYKENRKWLREHSYMLNY